MRPTHVCFDPLLDAAQADAMIELCSRFGTYSTYGSDAAPEERGQTRFAPEVPQRYDAADEDRLRQAHRHEHLPAPAQ